MIAMSRFKKAPAGPVELTLYSKPECPLCDTLERELAGLLTPGEAVVTKVSIETDVALSEAWGWRIPVVAAGDEVLAEGRLNAAAFRARFDVLRERRALEES